MGKALMTINAIIEKLQSGKGAYLNKHEWAMLLLMLHGQKSVVIALEDLSFTVKDIAKAIRER